MAKKTKVRQHERTAPSKNKGGSLGGPIDNVREWMKKENDKTQKGFREWEVPPEEKRGKR